MVSLGWGYMQCSVHHSRYSVTNLRKSSLGEHFNEVIKLHIVKINEHVFLILNCNF